MLKKIAALAVVCCFCSAESECRFDPKDRQLAAAFLRLTKSSSSPQLPCVTLALRSLATPKAISESRLVLEFLDFRVRSSAQAGSSRRIPWVGADYPAIDTVVAMGHEVISDLVEYLGADRTSDLGRRNGLLALRLLKKNDHDAEVIRLLVSASRGAADVIARRHLLDLAGSVAESCHPDHRSRCDFERTRR